MRRAALILLAALPGHGAAALDLDLPAGAELVHDAAREGAYALPVGAWDGVLPTQEVTGTILQQVWQMPGSETDLAALLAAQLAAQGYEIRLSCRDSACGGFDFRDATEVVSAPDMYVDLGDFAFLSAVRPAEEGGTEALGLLVSRMGGITYLQLIRALPPGIAEQEVAISTRTAPVATGPFLQTLTSRGSTPLDDLVFGTGEAALDAAEYPSLAALAEFLLANPEVTVALVGHTDATGSLEGNIALSRDRAQAVRAVLTESYGVPATQVEAHGVGYLAPRAANDDQAGREQNRRVEVVITSTR